MSRSTLPEVPGHVWTCAPGRRADRYGDGCAGMPLHAVKFATNTTACGFYRTRWNADLFNDTPCVRCLRALGLACPACRGTGGTGAATCHVCFGRRTLS